MKFQVQRFIINGLEILKNMQTRRVEVYHPHKTFTIYFQLFEELEEFQPAVLLIDECDGLLSSRENSKSDDTSTRVKSKFLTKFEELQNSKMDVIVLCTTNRYISHLTTFLGVRGGGNKISESSIQTVLILVL